jgi:hypothetical protein
MNAPPDLRAVAERVVWFETPEESLSRPQRFLAYLMTFGTLDDVVTARRYFSEQDFEAVLDDPPAGIFDIRSWSYWNGVYHRRPVPPLPQRKIPG